MAVDFVSAEVYWCIVSIQCCCLWQF